MAGVMHIGGHTAMQGQNKTSAYGASSSRRSLAARNKLGL